MARAIPHYIARIGETKNKGEYIKYLQAILHKYENHLNFPIDDQKDILDLKEFITQYSDKREALKNIFNLEDCYFVVRISEEGTPCIYIVDNNDISLSEQISIHNFGKPPKPFDNFKRLFVFVIREIKEQKRIEMCWIAKVSPNDFDLYHNQPKTENIVRDFLRENGLEDKISQIISPNGKGNEIPYLTEEYKYLKPKICDFYFNRISKNLIDLRLIKKKCE